MSIILSFLFSQVAVYLTKGTTQTVMNSTMNMNTTAVLNAGELLELLEEGKYNLENKDFAQLYLEPTNQKEEEEDHDVPFVLDMETPKVENLQNCLLFMNILHEKRA